MGLSSEASLDICIVAELVRAIGAAKLVVAAAIGLAEIVTITSTKVVIVVSTVVVELCVDVSAPPDLVDIAMKFAPPSVKDLMAPRVRILERA